MWNRFVQRRRLRRVSLPAISDKYKSIEYLTSTFDNRHSTFVLGFGHCILTYIISGLSGLGDNVELLNTVFPLIAWAVCILLLSLPGLWFTVFAFSLLGHLSQIVFRNTSLRVERE